MGTRHRYKVELRVNEPDILQVRRKTAGHLCRQRMAIRSLLQIDDRGREENICEGAATQPVSGRNANAEDRRPLNALDAEAITRLRSHGNNLQQRCI